MKLTVCGSRGTCSVAGPAFSEFGHATTCYVLRDGDYAIVIDCGSGFVGAESALAGCRQVDILLTHLHYDHLIGLLHVTSIPAGAEVRFFSRTHGSDLKEELQRFFAAPFWPYVPEFADIRTVDPPESISLRHGITADFRISTHPDYGLLIRLRFNGKCICFVWDYEHGQLSLDDWVRNCDLAFYDGTYSDEDYETRKGWGHSTWRQGCLLAARTGVKQLYIAHHNPDYPDVVLRQAEQDAQALLPGTRFVREGEEIIF